ncbi:MAG: filament integrity protein FraC [Cyanobacteria bacterium P01_C01_bin.121]
MEYEPIVPLKMIVFQVLFLFVAIAIESGILRQRLRLGFQVSVKYATAVNLAAVVVGWIAFLVLEPLSPMEVKAQIMSYVLFNRLLANGWTTELGAILFAIALVSFFGTYLIKAKGLEYFLRIDKSWNNMKKQTPRQLTRDDRYAKARGGGVETAQANGDFADAVIQANAASFSVILLLLLLRFAIQGWIA